MFHLANTAPSPTIQALSAGQFLGSTGTLLNGVLVEEVRVDLRSPPLGLAIYALVKGGRYVDLRLFSDGGLESARNVKDESALAEAARKLPRVVNMHDWFYKFARYTRAAAQLAPSGLINLTAHMSFMGGVSEAWPFDDLMDYDKAFREPRNFTRDDQGWVRLPHTQLDNEYHLLNGIAIRNVSGGKAVAAKGRMEGSFTAQPTSTGTKRKGGDHTETCDRWNDNVRCDSDCRRRHGCRTCFELTGGTVSSHTTKEHSYNHNRSNRNDRDREDRYGNRKRDHHGDTQKSQRHQGKFPPSPMIDRGLGGGPVLPHPATVTPYVLSEWEERSKGFPDEQVRQSVLDGIKDGFSLGFSPGAPLGSVSRNSSKAEANASVVRDYLREEAEYGCIAGPFPTKPFPNLHRNKISVVPKPTETFDAEGLPVASGPTTDAFRLIVDLSAPKDKSVNDGIPDEHAKVKYTSLSSILDELVERGPDTLLGKIDFKRAYRSVAVKVEDRMLLGIFHEGSWYVDLCLPFGGRSCAKLFNTVGDVALHAFRKVAPNSFLEHYLDDYVTLGDPTSASEEFEAVVDAAAKMGIPLSEKKLERPSSRVKFLGFIVDAPSLSVSLPLDKKAKYAAKLAEVVGKKFTTRQTLLEIAGCLIHCCQVFPQGKPFLRSIFSKAHSVKEPHFKVNLTSEVASDLKWWHETLSEWVGISLLARGAWLPDLAFTSDAAGSIGYGIFTGEAWCAELWPQDLVGTNIAVLELVPLLISAELWSSSWQTKKILFRTDNMAVVYAVNGGLPKERRLVKLVKRLAQLSILHSFSYRAEHVPGVKNVEADLLSRDKVTDFLQLHPSLSEKRLRVDRDLLAKLLS